MKIVRRVIIPFTVSCLIGGAAWAATGFTPAPPSTSTQAGQMGPQSAQQPGTFQPGAPNIGGPAPGAVPPVNNPNNPNNPNNMSNQQPGIAGGMNENTDITSPGVAPQPNPAPTITAGPHTGALGVPPGTYVSNGSG